MRHHLRDHAAVEWALALLLPGAAPENPNRSSTPSRDRKEMAEVVFCLITEPDVLDPPHRQHHERIQSFNKLIGCRLYLFAIANDFVHHLGREPGFLPTIVAPPILAGEPFRSSIGGRRCDVSCYANRLARMPSCPVWELNQL
jgi:hypothetical protein